MSFGWSAGDVVAGVQLLVKVAVALKDTGGSASKYRETSVYLLSLANVVQQLQDPSNDLIVVKEDALAVVASLREFHEKITSKFEKRLGKNAEKDWIGWLRSSPRKVEYGLFLTKQVNELRNRVDTPIKSISLALGLAIHKQNIVSAEVGAETQNLVQELKDSLPDLSLEILAGVEVIVQNTINDHISKQESAGKYRSVGEWIKAIPVADTYRDILRGMDASSCLWIFHRDEFTNWRNSVKSAGHYPILWITGIPGSGKTRLATRVIEKLQEDWPVAYFYCDTKDEERRTVLSILRTWTWQILQQNTSQVNDVFKICEKEPAPNEGNLEKALQCAIKDLNQPVFVLDGIDECEEATRRKLYPLLAQLATTSRVLLVSREMPGSHRYLKTILPDDGLDYYRIVEDDNKQDINFYLEHSVKELEIGDDDVERVVISKLQNGANGMFLWAALMLEELSNPHFFAEEYLDGLDDLPDSLDALYGRILINLNGNAKTREVTRKLLQWLTCARRPLTLPEISSTLLITIDEENFKSKSRMPDEKLRDTLLRYCGSLIAVHDSKKGSPKVTLVHASLKDFLLEQNHSKEAFGYLILDAEETHTILAQECLTFICYENIDFDPCLLHGTEGEPGFEVELDEMKRRFNAYVEQYPLLKYASLNWWSHLAAASHSGSYASLRRFCTSVSKTVSWLQVILRYHGGRGKLGSSTVIEDLEGLLVVSRVLPQHGEFKDWLQPFLRSDYSRSSLSRFEQFMYCGGTNDFLPKISVATFFNFSEYVEMCLNNGANPNRRHYRGQTPLFAAAVTDAIDAAKVLVKHGADPNIIGQDKQVPLHAAIREDNWANTSPVPYTVAEFLLESGADPCYNNGYLLSHACLTAFPNDAFCVSLVSSMLKHGAKKVIDIGVNPYWSSLHWAVKRRASRLVDLLLANGATIDIGFFGDVVNTRKLETPLIQACLILYQSNQIIQSLLKAGASIKAIHRDNRTALHISSRQKPSLSKLLLDAGADINAIANDGSCPLHDAVREENIGLIDMLVARGAILDVEDSEGRTPLMLALEAQNPNNSGVITRLVNAGASVPVKGPWVVQVFGENDVQIRPRENTEQYWPQQPRDVFEVFWLLQHASSRNLPRSAIIRILDLGRYWLKSTSHRKEAFSVDEAAAKRASPYLTSEPLTGRSKAPVREIIFDVLSHDQGYSSYPECYGTYDNSWTFFEYGVETKTGNLFDYTGLDRTVMVNVHAKAASTRHRVIGRPHGTNSLSMLLKRLDAGDKVSLSARALFPGWVNFVEEATIEIFTTCFLDWAGDIGRKPTVATRVIR
jgi:ankyrin repeat protein/nucleoside-triphosphatase THEP1